MIAMTASTHRKDMDATAIMYHSVANKNRDKFNSGKDLSNKTVDLNLLHIITKYFFPTGFKLHSYLGLAAAGTV